MKKNIVLAFTLLAVACSPKEDSLEQKRKLLSEKQTQLTELEKEVEQLQSEIAEMDTTAIESGAVRPVEVVDIKTQSFDHYVELTGNVSSKENILISAEAGGRVESIVVKEGQKVSRGQVLIRLENSAVANQLAEARAAFELAETTYRKRKNLWEQNIGSEIEYLQAKTNYESTKSRFAQVQSQFNNTIVKSPINGSVDDIRVNEGEFVSFGAPIVRVVDLDNVEIEAELSEEYLAHIQKGDSVRVNIPALGIRLNAPVSFVSQVINPDNRSFKIKVNLKNKDGRIKPNVLANLQIRDYTNKKALVVPSRIITKDLKGEFVYVISDDNGDLRAHKQYIKKGRSFGPETEITEGLKVGDKVVVAGYNQVSNGEKVSLQ